MDYKEPGENFLVSMYNQYWSHGRHIEESRLKLFASYLVVVGIVIYALYGRSGLDDNCALRVMLITFEIVLSGLFLLMFIKMEYVANMYIRSADRLLEAARIDEKKYGKAHWLTYRDFIRSISISRVFNIVYILCLLLFINLLIYELYQQFVVKAVIVSTLIWLVVSVLIYMGVILRDSKVPN